MICVLQFDAASIAVVDRMLGAGRLPVLAGLIARGEQMTLDTPADHFAAGAFHTLYSGIELADHGLFYPFQWDAAAQRARYGDWAADTPAGTIATLRAFADAGMEYAIVKFLDAPDLASVRRFAEEVMPAFATPGAAGAMAP